MRWLKGLAITVVALFILIPVSALLLVGTTTGSKWVLDYALELGLEPAGIRVTYDKFDGRLLDGLQLSDATVKTDAITIQMATAKLNWQPLALLDNELLIDSLALEGVHLTLISSQNPEQNPKQEIQLPTLRLPISLSVNEFRLTDAWLESDGPEPAQLLVTDLVTQLQWQDTTLSLNQLVIVYQTSSLRGKGILTTAKNYPFAFQADYQWQVEQDAIAVNAINGTIELDGALKETPIKLQSNFSADGIASQRITATLSEPLNDLQWALRLQLQELPLQLFDDVIKQRAPQLPEYINASTELSGEVTATTALIELIEVSLIDFGPGNGSVRLNGAWQHNNFSTNYNSQHFDFTANYTNLSLGPIAETLAANSLAIIKGDVNLNGTPENYKFATENQVSYYLTTKDAEPQQMLSKIVAVGSGDLQEITLDKLEASSNNFDLAATAHVAWQPELAVRLDISNGTAVLADDDQSSSVSIAGGVLVTGDVISADELTLAVGQSRMLLNGTTAGDNKVYAELVIGALQELPGMPVEVTELESLTLNFELTADDSLENFEVLISELAIATESLDSWSTTNASSLKVSQTDTHWQFQSEAICLHHDEGSLGSICQTLTSNQANLFVEFEGRGLSLRLLNRFREQDVAQRVAGHINVFANAQLKRDTFNLVGFTATLNSDTTVFFALDQETSTRLAYWELEAKGDANAITATLSGTLTEDQGGLIGDFQLSDLYGEQNVQGSLLFQLDDLAMLDWVLPGLRYEGGKATAALTLNGTLGYPQLEGDMEVFAETVGFAQTNLVFKEVRLALIDNPETQGELEILGQARSGDKGWLLIEGLAVPLAQEAYLAIEGQDFRALQLPTATVDISPNLRVYLKDQLIDIAGTVDVPFATITAPEFDNAVSRSPDVVVTRNGEQVSAANNNLGGIQVQAAVRVNLSDNVSVNAYGFEGKLSGSLEVVEQPRRPLTAVGSINVTEGLYTLYGQELTIDRGSFIYNGGTISNPGLNLRVQREIAGGAAARNVNVGAQVAGTLIEPNFRLFSTPAMPDSEVLSYLILGRSMQSASSSTSSNDLQLQALLMLGAKGTEAIGESLQDTFGFDEFGLDSDSGTRETSFYVGKYLSPKLYVKYGIGLLDSTNTFMVRYQLTERLLIETMTSSRAQGGDIFYTFER
ncbi:translocation/assembly module TamB domain-containing protein [Pseudidiomarina sp. E22-M8]|uniref:translocation/assembly module TamB domain-containing protein n=1 Tax=Pseudidiomarina sp. E22-M8 TaxID=3424768 RepID=UPI00403D0466